MDKEDIGLLVAKRILKGLRTQQMQVEKKVTEHLNKLIDAINNVKTTVEAETYGVYPSIPLVTPELVSLIKVEIDGTTLETGTTTGAFDDVVKEFATLQVDFSKISLGLFYEIEHLAAMEIGLRENVLSYQERKKQRKEK